MDLGAIVSTGTSVLNGLGQLGAGQPITIGGITVTQTTRTGTVQETPAPADKSVVVQTQAVAVQKTNNTLKYIIIGTIAMVVALYFFVYKK